MASKVRALGRDPAADKEVSRVDWEERGEVVQGRVCARLGSRNVL